MLAAAAGDGRELPALRREVLDTAAETVAALRAALAETAAKDRLDAALV